MQIINEVVVFHIQKPYWSNHGEVIKHLTKYSKQHSHRGKKKKKSLYENATQLHLSPWARKIYLLRSSIIWCSNKTSHTPPAPSPGQTYANYTCYNFYTETGKKCPLKQLSMQKQISCTREEPTHAVTSQGKWGAMKPCPAALAAEPLLEPSPPTAPRRTPLTLPARGGKGHHDQHRKNHHSIYHCSAAETEET